MPPRCDEACFQGLLQSFGCHACARSALQMSPLTVAAPPGQVPFEVEAAGTDAAAGISANALISSKYGAGPLELARACLRRGVWQLSGLKDMHIGRL